MKDTVFIERLMLAASQPSAYMWGTFGMKITESLINQKAKQYPARYSDARKNHLKSLSSGLCWAWDCAGLIKGILWGWNSEAGFPYGGGVYSSNGVPDTNVNGLERNCSDLSSDFTSLIPGELLFMPDHVGVYIGDGQVIEATLGTYGDGVVYTKLAGRGWTHHGKLNYIEYTEEEDDNLKTYIHVQKIGLYVRNTITFDSKNRAAGTIVAFCPTGKEMELLEFIPGIQKDGYQWVRTRYNGVEGYSQYDSQCYYIYKK